MDATKSRAGTMWTPTMDTTARIVLRLAWQIDSRIFQSMTVRVIGIEHSLYRFRIWRLSKFARADQGINGIEKRCMHAYSP